MKSKKIIIGLVSPTDIEDRRASSGTIFKIAHTLEGLGYEVRWIKVRYNNMSDKIYRYVNKLSKCMIGLDFASSNRLKFAKKSGIYYLEIF